MSVIDEYLAHVNAPQKAELERIREIVKKTVPDAQEVISYGMPAFKYKHKYLIAFSAFKHHMSIFPASHAVEALKEKLGDFKLSKGTIQFTIDHPVPESIIKELINVRQADIS